MIFKIVKRENPFVQIDKTPLNNTTLSFKAKGILTYLLSKPPNWRPSLEELIKASRDSRDSVMAGLKELEAAGHFVKQQARGRGGKFARFEYLVYEVPIIDQDTPPDESESPQPENPNTAEPQTDFPNSGKPYSGKPYSENRSLIIIDPNNNLFNSTFAAQIWQVNLNITRQTGKPVL